MKEEIIKLREEFESEISGVGNLNDLSLLKVKYLGKKSKIQTFSSSMKDLSIDEKKEVGKIINEFKNYLESSFSLYKEKLEKEELESKLRSEAIDITLPSTKIRVGSIHPITKIINEVEDLFVSMGYDVLEGPEVESDLYNFEMLNLPIRIICPGKTYRKDNDDATHSHQFTQIEGLVVDKNISMSDLKGTLEIFAKRMFGSSREIRFRPSYFPFTEPSIEVDVSCFNCGGKGCNICKNTGWIEILGAGMVHPNVLNMCGYDSDKFTGFAFGIGPERIAMLKYGITDIRNFYTNDMRFLKEFDKVEKVDYES